MDKIKIITVDDSSFMQAFYKKVLTALPDVDLVAQPRNGKEGYEAILKYVPDLVFLDVEMPIMNGLEALKKVMKECPVPVVVVSTLTKEGSVTALDAMKSGALDYITKESQINNNAIADDILRAVKTFSTSDFRLRFRNHNPLPASTPKPTVTSISGASSNVQTKYKENFAKQKLAVNSQLILIGVSTGGPATLNKLVSQIQPTRQPILIVQHMPALFTKSLAANLSSICKMQVIEGENGMDMEGGKIYIAPGGMQTNIIGTGTKPRFKVEPSNPKEIYNPGVDVVCRTLSTVVGSRALCIMLTGMGDDGLVGFKQMKKLGAKIISQDESSSIVFGMPKAIIDNDLADEVVSITNLAARINFHTS